MISTLDIIGSIIGLVYIVSEYRASRWFWPSSLLMSAFYMVIYFNSHCYANASICVYNLLMSIYGLLVWRGVLHSANNNERPVGSCPARIVPLLLTAFIILAVGLYFLLGMLGESKLPVIDGISSALTIVAMWMLAQKYWQQWFCWMIVEPLMIALCLLSGLYFSAFMYAIYEVFCILGIIAWRKMYLNTENNE